MHNNILNILLIKTIWIYQGECFKLYLMETDNTGHLKSNKGIEKMKTLILKGLGKARVRKIVKQYMEHCFNLHLEYGHSEAFTFPLYQTIEGFGLPKMDEDNPFDVGELVEFLGGKI